MNDFATTATCQRGDLPLTLNDRYCSLMGGPDYRFNYTKIGCHARQSSGGCKVHCKHGVQLQKKEKAVALPVPVDIPASVPEIPVQSIKESVMSSNRSFKRCVGCDKDRLITGRGLCGGCYSRLRKLPDFDLNYPPRPYKCRSKTKKAEILAKKTAGVIAVDDGVFQESPARPAREKSGEGAAAASLPCGGEHSEGEECLLCCVCGQCREDLDSEGVCIDCGGVVEKDSPEPGHVGSFDRLAKSFEDVIFAPVEGRPVALRSTTREGVDVVRLEFLERDCELLAYIETWAAEERRSLSDQILYVLGNVVFERQQVTP